VHTAITGSRHRWLARPRETGTPQAAAGRLTRALPASRDQRFEVVDHHVQRHRDQRALGFERADTLVRRDDARPDDAQEEQDFGPVLIIFGLFFLKNHLKKLSGAISGRRILILTINVFDAFPFMLYLEYYNLRLFLYGQTSD